MKFIKKMVKRIDDEIESAMYYAEKYVESKSNGENVERYKAMTIDELNHAKFLHELAVKSIDKLSKVYSASPDMLEKWTNTHNDYLTKVSEIERLINI